MRALFGKYGLALAIVWVYVYSFPYFAKIRHANELPRVYLTKAIVDEGTLTIDSGVKRWGKTVDVSRAYGRYFSNKAPGSSFLAAPGYLALKAFNGLLGRGEPTLVEMVWVCRITSGVIPTLLFLMLMVRFLTRMSRAYEESESESEPDAEITGSGTCVLRNDAARMALCGYALGSLALIYSIQFMAHQLSAICIGTAYILSVWVIEDGRDPRLMWLAGLAAGCAPLVDYQAAFAGVPLAVYLLVKLGGARRFKHLAFAVLGAIPPIFALLAYHNKCFHSPFKTGYDFSQTFAHFHQKGFLGITELRWEAFYGSTFEPDNGLFLLCPMLLLAFVGWYFMARRRMYWHLGITASVFVIYLAFISSINFWRGGWQVGPRYVTAMLPFVMVPVTVALTVMVKDWRWRGVALGMIVSGIVIYTLTGAVFPHFPEKFANPIYEVTLRLIGDGYAPYNLGYAVGLRGALSLVPLVLILAALLAWLALGPRARVPEAGGDDPARAVVWHRWRSVALGVAVAGALLALYSLFDDGGRPAARAYKYLTTLFPS